MRTAGKVTSRPERAMREKEWAEQAWAVGWLCVDRTCDGMDSLAMAKDCRPTRGPGVAKIATAKRRFVSDGNANRQPAEVLRRLGSKGQS